jgi:hypothetical protein
MLKEIFRRHINIYESINNLNLDQDKLNEILKGYLEEDYPTNFNLEEFSNLTSFKQRKEYCQERLKRIAMGTSRITYMVDDTKVLKLAYNKKGLAQNDIEATYSRYRDVKNITAEVFAYDKNDFWVEMELAKKVTPQIFEKVVGYSFNDYISAMNNHYFATNPQRSKNRRKRKIDDELVDEMWENDFIYDMLSFLGNYDAPVGDLMKIDSYGLVKRDGVDAIVLIDYGVTNDVWDSYYD